MSSPTLTKDDVKNFIELCEATHEAYIATRRMWGDEKSTEFHHDYPLEMIAILHHLNATMIDMFYLKVGRLHDVEKISGRYTLAIDFVVKRGPWDSSTKGKLEKLQGKMDALVGRDAALPEDDQRDVRRARHWLLAHNSLYAYRTLGKNGHVGVTKDGEWDEYFKNLQEFCQIVHQHFFALSFKFSDALIHEVDAFKQHLRQRSN